MGALLNIPIPHLILLLTVSLFGFYFCLMFSIMYYSIDDEIEYGSKNLKDNEKEFSRKLLEIYESLNDEEIAYKNLKKSTPPYKKVYKNILSVIIQSKLPVSAYAYVLYTGIITVIVMSIVLVIQGPIQAVAVGIGCCITALLLNNIQFAKKRLIDEEDILQFMNINTSNYMLAPFIEDAFRTTRDVINPTGVSFKAINRYLNNVMELNISREKALDMMKSDFEYMTIPSYMVDQIIKAEMVNQDYKQVLIGITENYEIHVKESRAHVKGLMFGLLSYALMGMGMIGCTLTNGLNPVFNEGLRTVRAVSFLVSSSYVLYAVSGIALFFSAMSKLRKEWD